MARVAPPTPISPSVPSLREASSAIASGPPTTRVLWPALVRVLETSTFDASVQMRPYSRITSDWDASPAAAGQYPSIVS